MKTLGTLVVVTVKICTNAENVGNQSLSDDLIHRLRTRADIRRNIPCRKSVQEGKPDRLADLLDEAAYEIEKLNELVEILREEYYDRQ